MMNIKEDILKNAGNKKLMVPIDFQSISFLTMDVFGDRQLFGFSKYLLLCSTKEKHLYRFGTT